jgi:hypothetical protein
MPTRPPFDPVRAAMYLLAVLICTPSLLVLMTTLRCAIVVIPECFNRPWVGIYRDWLSETVPVLVAIIMAGRLPPSPPPPPPAPPPPPNSE